MPTKTAGFTFVENEFGIPSKANVSELSNEASFSKARGKGQKVHRCQINFRNSSGGKKCLLCQLEEEYLAAKRHKRPNLTFCVSGGIFGCSKKPCYQETGDLY